jgi:hypothetical protein
MGFLRPDVMIPFSIVLENRLIFPLAVILSVYFCAPVNSQCCLDSWCPTSADVDLNCMCLENYDAINACALGQNPGAFGCNDNATYNYGPWRVCCSIAISRSFINQF